uniref:Transcriptional regulator, LuxR family n=1 Tax=Rhodopseudomonas palustris (strain BisA53) TaxID=316055 RepID=Q07I18_RHOP5
MLRRLSDALQVAPYQPAEWMTALRMVAQATNSTHGEMVCWTKPKKTPLRLISNLSDEQAKLIQDWEIQVGADPSINPIVAAGISAPVLQTVTDDEVIRHDERSRHVVWNEYYHKLDIYHMCFSPLWRSSDSIVGLFLLRSFRDGAVSGDERRLFGSIASKWRDAALTAQSFKTDGARILAGALEGISIHAIILDGFGRCVHVSPVAESLLSGDDALTVRMDRLRRSDSSQAVADCQCAGRLIAIDADLQPCIDCVTRLVGPGGSDCRSCSIVVKGPSGISAQLRISSIPRDRHEISFGAAAIVVIDPPVVPSSIELLTDVASALTKAEREVALEMLDGRRPAEIAVRRSVSVETIRSQIKRIYAKLEVSGLVEFMAKAKR